MIEVLAGSYPLWHDLAKRTIEISWGRTLIATMAMAMRVRPDSVRLFGVLVSNATTTLPTGPAIVPRYILLAAGTIACGRCGAVNEDYSSLARPVLTCTAHNQPRI